MKQLKNLGFLKLTGKDLVDPVQNWYVLAIDVHVAYFKADRAPHTIYIYVRYESFNIAIRILYGYLEISYRFKISKQFDYYSNRIPVGNCTRH